MSEAKPDGADKVSSKYVKLPHIILLLGETSLFEDEKGVKKWMGPENVFFDCARVRRPPSPRFYETWRLIVRSRDSGSVERTAKYDITQSYWPH